ncbi:MAG TPA: hypothetical protein VI462_14660 [Acidimicrobiia bacterium]
MWTYEVLGWNPASSWGGIAGVAGLRAALETLGADGWELVTQFPLEGSIVLLFKKPKPGAA